MMTTAVRQSSALAAAIFALRLSCAIAPAPDLRSDVRLAEREARELSLKVGESLRLLPGFNIGDEGRPGDALNVVFVANEDELLNALGAAGWTRVPRDGITSMAQGFCELAEGRWPAAFPPMKAYTLFGRRQDHNFSIQTGFPYSRHHFRLWKSPFQDEKGRPIWWAAAEFDVDIRWGDLSHVTDPNIDRERNFIATTLRGLAKQLSWVRLPQIPREGADDRGYAWRNDGRVLLATF